MKYASTLVDVHLNAVWSSRVQTSHDSSSRASSEYALKEVREKEIPEWFACAFERLLKRRDGVWIAIGYIAHLSRCVLLGKGMTQDPNDRWNVYSVALNALGTIVGRLEGFSCAKDDAQIAVARNWFFEVYRAARRLWLTAVLDVERKKRDLVSVCFAFMPSIFGDTLGAALAHTIPPIVNEPILTAQAAAYLLANGIEPRKLMAFMTAVGVDLEPALRDAQQWAELSGDNRSFPEHLQSLAREVGIDFPRTAVTIE